MGIQVEFNPDLALRAFGTQNREQEECLPEKLEPNTIHRFLKKGQRNYWLEGEVPLCETSGDQDLSKPIASIKILESTHFSVDKKLFTKGKYKVEEVFDVKDNKINFEAMKRIK